MEITGGHGEFGMSGGAVISPEGEFRGLLSHQILSREAGELDDSNRSQDSDSVLAIPAANVKDWLKDVLTAEGELISPLPIELFQDPAQQASDFPSLRTANIYISFSAP